MDPKAFVDLVAEMRAAQKRWFSKETRTQEILDESRRLERAVDRAIAEMRDDQPTLFPES